MLVLFIYITRLASNEKFSPSNKIHREGGRVKYLSAPPYLLRNHPTFEAINWHIVNVRSAVHKKRTGQFKQSDIYH